MQTGVVLERSGKKERGKRRRTCACTWNVQGIVESGKCKGMRK